MDKPNQTKQGLPREDFKQANDKVVIASTRKPYRTPQLTLYGNLTSLTLGPSVGVGESGANGNVYKPFGVPDEILKNGPLGPLPPK